MNESQTPDTQHAQHTQADPWSWRSETPGSDGWPRTARVDDPNKYFMVSADCHANEPSDLWHERLDRVYIDRLPPLKKKPDGTTIQVSDGFRQVRNRHIVLGTCVDRGRLQCGR